MKSVNLSYQGTFLSAYMSVLKNHMTFQMQSMQDLKSAHFDLIRDSSQQYQFSPSSCLSPAQSFQPLVLFLLVQSFRICDQPPGLSFMLQLRLSRLHTPHSLGSLERMIVHYIHDYHEGKGSVILHQLYHDKIEPELQCWHVIYSPCLYTLLNLVLKLQI